jgi:hypothetical protein
MALASAGMAQDADLSPGQTGLPLGGSLSAGPLVQLNLGEGRHSLARDLFHGKRRELHQRYREGQEDQLSALGLVVNVIVLWNTIYMDAALSQLRLEGYLVCDEDVARLSPFGHEHVNMLGRYSLVARNR